MKSQENSVEPRKKRDDNSKRIHRSKPIEIQGNPNQNELDFRDEGKDLDDVAADGHFDDAEREILAPSVVTEADTSGEPLHFGLYEPDIDLIFFVPNLGFCTTSATIRRFVTSTTK